jgi:hypothetical protein
MHGVVLAVNRHIVGISLLVVAILAFAVAQALLVPLTIPLVEQMAAANTERARYVDSDRPASRCPAVAIRSALRPATTPTCTARQCTRCTCSSPGNRLIPSCLGART